MASNLAFGEMVFRIAGHKGEIEIKKAENEVPFALCTRLI